MSTNANEPFLLALRTILKNAEKKGQNPILGIGKMGLKNGVLKQSTETLNF